MPGILRDTIYRQVIANLNAAPGDYENAVVVDEAYDPLAVVDAILNQETYLMHKIAESWFNGHRTNEGSPLADLIVTENVANGGLIPAHIGPVIGVTIDNVPAEICAASAVGRLRAKNPLKLRFAGQLYGLEDNRLYFTSESSSTTDAQVHLFQFPRPDFDDDLNDFKNSFSPVPGEYQQAWIDLSTGAVMPREGAMMQAAMAYTVRGERIMQELMGENRPRAVLRDAQMGGE